MTTPHRTCISKVLGDCDPCQVPSLAIDVPIISVFFSLLDTSQTPLNFYWQAIPHG